jgi:hypothetical protein
MTFVAFRSAKERPFAERKATLPKRAAMRCLIVSALAFVACCAGCDRPRPVAPADAKALHEEMRKLNEEVLRQERRPINPAKKQ